MKLKYFVAAHALWLAAHLNNSIRAKAGSDT
jgi:hypothetical protein